MKIHFTRYSIEKCFLVLMLLVLTAWCTSVSALEIPLTIKEPAGIERQGEPVTSGIPLTPGAQTTNWSLFDGTQEIPLQVTSLPGRNPWVLLDFQVDIPASGKKVLLLSNTPSSVSADKPIVIDEDTTQITVITGPLKLLMKKDPFNFFEAVWLDRDDNGSFTSSERIVSSSGDNIQIVDSTSGQTFSGTGVPDKVVWEYRGTMRATLRVDGRYRNSSGEFIAYTTKITFYAGRPDVKIEHVLRNSYQQNERHVKVKSATLKLGQGGTIISTACSGMESSSSCTGPIVAWANVGSDGLTFDLIPDSKLSNGGLVVPDLSYHGANIVIDFSEGLSQTEQTKRANAALSKLFALAPPSWYSEHGELSTTRFGTLGDEKETYQNWGWTWTPDQEPTDTHKPNYWISWKDVDVHDDSEADDLWQNILMYLRTGQRGYYDRAMAWARYFKWEYPFRTDGFDFAWDSGWEDPNALVKRPKIAIPLTSEDQSYLTRDVSPGKVDALDWGASHMWGWGLIDYYYLTGDTDALDAAIDLAEISERILGWRQPGSYRVSTYGVRLEARHLLITTRLYEATTDARWNNYMNHLGQLFVQSPDWDARGSYLWEMRGYPNTVSTLHFGFLNFAFDRYYHISGNSQIRDRLIQMANFVKIYGIDPGTEYTGDIVFDHPNPGDWFHLFRDDPNPTIALIDSLVRGYRLTGDTSLLERAKYHWHRGSKTTYGHLDERTAGDNEVGRFLNDAFLSGDVFYVSNGDLSYAHLLFHDYAHPTSPDTTPPAPPTGLVIIK